MAALNVSPEILARFQMLEAPLALVVISGRVHMKIAGTGEQRRRLGYESNKMGRAMAKGDF